MIVSTLSCSLCIPYKIDPIEEVKVDIDVEKSPQENTPKNRRPLQRWKSCPTPSPSRVNNSLKESRSKKRTKDVDSDILHINGILLPQIPEEGAIGVITMEDVIEELLQVLIKLSFE